ncbi:MAG TPA: response regulator [Thermoanaerobaculia bacterium]|nr:response regulator [Thermoanaerobaculia bacterium]HUM31147.1 response regulator [Thermoanaerobaculia bacterium]HXK69503.1 response regulator [Thermoanaerobaculia bacterium]
MKRVMVVEDSDSMRAYIVGALEGIMVDVVEASTGFEALKQIPHNPVDLVVTDINMPDINGLELIHFLKQHPHTRNIPIIVISTERSQEDQERAMEMGAVDYLVKPFNIETFRAKVNQLLEGTENDQNG